MLQNNFKSKTKIQKYTHLKNKKGYIYFTVANFSKTSALTKIQLFLHRICTLVLGPFLTCPMGSADLVAHLLDR